MSKASEKELVMKCIKEFSANLTTFRSLLPCIITHDKDDTKLMKDAYKVAGQMLDFIDDCDGDLALLSEEFDIQRIIDEYPKIQELLSESHTRTSVYDTMDTV